MDTISDLEPNGQGWPSDVITFTNSTESASSLKFTVQSTDIDLVDNKVVYNIVLIIKAFDQDDSYSLEYTEY